MKEKIRYGTTLHADDSVAKYTTYTFDSMQELKVFWEENKNKGRYNADLKKLTVTYQEYVSSEEYFLATSPLSSEVDF